MKSIGVNKIIFNKQEVDLTDETLKVGLELEFGNVWDKNDIQFIMKKLKSITVEDLLELLKKK